jgi:hypothetical protein
LVRKVKFRVLTSYENRMYNLFSRSASAFSVVFLRERRVVDLGKGRLKGWGAVSDSSLRIRINEPWVTCARYWSGKGVCEFMFNSLLLEVCL